MDRSLVFLLRASAGSAVSAENIADSLTQAQAGDGSYISWHEHIIDDPTRGVTDLSGSAAGLDGDGLIKPPGQLLRSVACYPINWYPYAWPTSTRTGIWMHLLAHTVKALETETAIKPKRADQLV